MRALRCAVCRAGWGLFGFYSHVVCVISIAYSREDCRLHRVGGYRLRCAGVTSRFRGVRLLSLLERIIGARAIVGGWLLMMANTPSGPAAGSRPGEAGSSSAGGGLAPSGRGGVPGARAGRPGSGRGSAGFRRARRWYLFHASREILPHQKVRSPIPVAMVTKPITRRAARACYGT